MGVMCLGGSEVGMAKDALLEKMERCVITRGWLLLPQRSLNSWRAVSKVVAQSGYSKR